MTKHNNKSKNSGTNDTGLGVDEAQRNPRRRPLSSRPSSISFNDLSLTQQQFKNSVDVNNIIKHYQNTGIDPYESRKQNLRFGNATSKGFTEAMYQVAEVNSAFADLPAKIRQTFSNDPSRWLTHLEEAAQGLHEIVDPDASHDVSDGVDPSDTPQLDLKTEDLNIT